MLSTCCCTTRYDLSTQISRTIDKEIERERREKRKQREVKILLLGAGESGKSTFLKQMRLIHGIGFESVIDYQHIIYSNVVQGMRVLCDARSKLGIPWEEPSNQVHSDVLLSTRSFIDQYKFLQLVPLITSCWKDQGIKETYRRRNLFQISDSVSYFYNELERISGKDWTPTSTDVLHSRSATKGIYELNININRIPFKFIDVGGQRSQRSKWLQCFDGVTTLLFMVATAEFDQVLLEDRTTNRLKEAMTIFDVIINNRVFSSVSVILFLNKYDLLREKVSSPEAHSRLSEYFPEYTGSDKDINGVSSFILGFFKHLNRRNKEFYYHFTTAIDTENNKIVFNDVKATILNRNLQELMLR